MENKKIIVVKLGSSILMTQHSKLDESRMAHIADQVRSLKGQGFCVILVVSGAVASGSDFLRAKKNDALLKQAAAGIGQAVLTAALHQIFSSKKLQIAQILLTKRDLNRKLKLTLQIYLNNGFIPVINENDVISLNDFNGNDNLASKIAALINANKLLILSTFDKSLFGVGGGESKLKAIEEANSHNILAGILDGKQIGSILEAVL